MSTQHGVGAMMAFAICLLPVAASATSDTGRSARLLGVFDGQRYALVVDENVQEGWPLLEVTAYVVDLHEAALSRLHVTPIPATKAEEATDAELVAAIAKKLPKDVAAKLKTLTPPAKLKTLKMKKKPVFKDGKVTWTLKLTRTAKVDSMRAYSRKGKDVLCALLVPDQPKAVCSTCSAVVRDVGGEKVETRACKKGAGKTKHKGKEVPCDCHAMGEVRRLDVTRRGGGPKVVGKGSSVLLEPHRMAQNEMAGRQKKEDISAQLSLTGHVLKDGRAIFVGAAVNSPVANGTYFPVVAVSQPK